MGCTFAKRTKTSTKLTIDRLYFLVFLLI